MSIELMATSIADRAYGTIRADIVFGRLSPGARLRLDRLADVYGASVSTLREILSRLSSEGLVIAEGQRGFRVASVSPAGFEDVAAMRLLLETYALPLSFSAGDLEWESRVVAAHHKLAFMERRMLAGDQKDTELWKRYDREFHQSLIEACGSQTLLDLYGSVFDQYLRYQMVAVVFRGEIAAEEHRTLLDSVLTRNADRACAVLTQHVNGCVAYTLESGALV
ncbi:GntR family transcriptional regulator [Microvirga sp. 3-52]|uniref:GntR family transcriptional regulator n=1 Tax=Microvirga sp. 3-52 TaxID=2792425 RepID=UPI001AC6F531|nr:GntR family transcriptional regulator [Microvirga sp. 3-52]MBO1908677.1 GntR family transcriptional regulator [Microvirga sp. 3-52]MBS7455134.1 GntR family transcriptional regulator [Microvirga sp. 3-52]